MIGGAIVAPPKDRLILPGITYGAAWDFAREAGIPFEIRPVTKAEALARRRDVAHVVDEGSARYHDARRPAVRRRQTGPLFRKMHALFQAHKAAGRRAVPTHPAVCVVPNRP